MLVAVQGSGGGWRCNPGRRATQPALPCHTPPSQGRPHAGEPCWLASMCAAGLQSCLSARPLAMPVRQGQCCCALSAGCTRRRGRQFWPRQVAPLVSARSLNQGHHPAHMLVTFSHGKVACHLQIKLSSVAVGREKSVCLCQEMDLEPEVRRGRPQPCLQCGCSILQEQLWARAGC